MLRKTATVVIIACCLLVSCTISDHSPDKALKPEGEKVEITLASGRTTKGELLSVDDTTIYFLLKKEVSRVLMQEHIYSAPISEVKFVEVKGYGLRFKKDIAAQLTPYCRYPHGLSSSQWQQLLKHYSQTSIFTM